jgi:thiopeptide-type bacteriocin biosynthesis protein
MDNSPAWLQVNIAFSDWSRAEQTALARLAPLLRTTEDEGAISAWFFIRKRPCWRVRYVPAADAHVRIGGQLEALTVAGHIAHWTPAIYEPEVHAFGGVEAMTAAHHLFHRDSRDLLTYLQREDGAANGHRREISLMLCSILMRSAGLDWYEQGDVWARVAAHRALPTATDQSITDRLHTAVHRLITVDAEDQLSKDGPLAYAAGWANAYTVAGQELAHLAASGSLHRGLRDVLAHHVIFAWNRMGLPFATQAALAATAKSVIFGPDPTAESGVDTVSTIATPSGPASTLG